MSVHPYIAVHNSNSSLELLLSQL